MSSSPLDKIVLGLYYIAHRTDPNFLSRESGVLFLICTEFGLPFCLLPGSSAEGVCAFFGFLCAGMAQCSEQRVNLLKAIDLAGLGMVEVWDICIFCSVMFTYG